MKLEHGFKRVVDACAADVDAFILILRQVLELQWCVPNVVQNAYIVYVIT